MIQVLHIKAFFVVFENYMDYNTLTRAIAASIVNIALQHNTNS